MIVSFAERAGWLTCNDLTLKISPARLDGRSTLGSPSSERIARKSLASHVTCWISKADLTLRASPKRCKRVQGFAPTHTFSGFAKRFNHPRELFATASCTTSSFSLTPI